MSLEQFLELVGQALTLDYIVAATVAGLVIGSFAYPLLSERLSSPERSVVPWLVLWLGIPTALVYYGTAVAVALLEGDPLWPRIIGRAVSVAIYIAAIAFGLWLRLRLRRY